jgi:D-glycero-D-manno-heptose 1,7-bisphosphate phosphatase
VGYLDRAERVALYPFAADAICALNRAGIRIVLVTNQSGVARGFFTEGVVEDVHRHIANLLAKRGAHIDAYYYCPHHPDGRVPQYAVRCECRKPGRALVDRAARELGIDPARSFTVGDRWLDVGLARTIGARGLLVRTGYGSDEEHRQPDGLSADAVVDNLVEAVSWILVNSR